MEAIFSELMSLDTDNVAGLSVFLEKLQNAMRALCPQKIFDSILLAENLAFAFYKAKQNNDALCPRTLCAKILRVYDCLDETLQKGEIGSHISNLWSCVNTFAKESNDSITQDLIGYRIRRIVNATGNLEDIENECKELTQLLQHHEAKIDVLPKNLHNHFKQSKKHKDFFDLKLAFLNKAFVKLKKLKNTISDSNENYLKGLEVTLQILEIRRLEIQDSIQQDKAKSVIERIEKNCTVCEEHSFKTISQAVTKNIALQGRYDNIKAMIGEYATLVGNMPESSGKFNGISSDLKIAIECYIAAQQLHQHLRDENVSNPIERPRNAKDFYLKPRTQETFKANPDGWVIQLFKKIGYLFGQLFTLGYGNFFMLPQEKLTKKTHNLFEAAHKEGLFEIGMVN